VWKTAWGSIALASSFALVADFDLRILICFDIENRDVLEKTLAQKPIMILNPAFIPLPGVNPNPHGNWIVGQDTMARKFERTLSVLLWLHRSCRRAHVFLLVMCKENGLLLVRCDGPVDEGGSGNSMVIDGCRTIYAPLRSSCALVVSILPETSFAAPAPERPRVMRIALTFGSPLSRPSQSITRATGAYHKSSCPSRCVEASGADML
jgi:hypothetical protein